MTKKTYERPLVYKMEGRVSGKAGPEGRIRQMGPIDGHEPEDLLWEYGSPLFVLSEKTIRRNYQRLHQAFATRLPRVQMAWSYKTNYLDAVCRVFHQEGAWAEVVSGFEFEKALQEMHMGKPRREALKDMGERLNVSEVTIFITAMIQAELLGVSIGNVLQIQSQQARETRRMVISVDYRLAPEHPFPAAMDDTLVAYRWLLAQGVSPERIVIVGESAGGGLALATLLALRDQGLPLPAGAVALSPWTDLELTGESCRTKVKVCISPLGMNRVCSQYYVGDNDPRLPWISPLHGDLHGLPPILINVGEDETMLDDSTRFAEKAKAAGVDMTLMVGPGMVHCYPLFAPLFPEATQAMAEICAWIKAQVGEAVPVTSG